MDRIKLIIITFFSILGCFSSRGEYTYPSGTHGRLSAGAVSIIIHGKEPREIDLSGMSHKEIDLLPEQNFFTIVISAPSDSTAARGSAIRFRLEGFEEDWREPRGDLRAEYTNVPAGKYVFVLLCSTLPGTTPERSEVKINVKSHWYATTWSKSLLGILALVLTLLLLEVWYKYIVSKERARVAELERDSLKQLNDAKLDFYARISHELRTPCFLISAQIEEMLDSDRQTIPVSSLHGIYRSSTKLNRLINHIIDFRKNDSGYLKLNARPTELVGFLSELIPDYKQLCKQKQLEFTFIHDDEPVMADIDPDKLEQIITNLISNSYKYTPAGGSVELKLVNLADEVKISVIDSGIGVSDKLRESIFDPFVRDEDIKDPGDGIGLAFVRELVELHGGSIGLESRLSEGSVFTVTLPKRHETNGSAPASQHLLYELNTVDTPEDNHLTHNHPSRSVMIVDDDPDVSRVLARAFADGYKVITAVSAEEALEKALKEKPAVVITDLMMPGGGHSLITELKSNPNAKDIKIVVFSALNTEDDMLKALDEGADLFLTKPTPLRVLRKHIDLLQDDVESAGTTDVEPDEDPSTEEDRRFMSEFSRIIEENMLDDNFGINMIAGKIAMSHSSLYKKVKRITGMSVIDFINKYRIEKAVKLFRAGNQNVQKVAEMCGFRDIKTFRETFKRRMNIPPKAFVNALREGTPTE